MSDKIITRTEEIEASRRLPDDLVRELGSADLFRLYVPSSLGGPEVDPMSACLTIEQLARADGSTGWTTLILNCTFFTAWLEPSIGRDVLEATGRAAGVASQFAPLGRGQGDGDGTIRLSGRYPFNSGAPHAAWFCQGAMVADHTVDPQWRFLFVPATDVEILDTWHVAGLRGTASHDVVITDVPVAVELTANPVVEPARQDAPHFRWSFFALLASLIAGFPLGVARRALDEFEMLAASKARQGGAPLATEQLVQVEIARCEGALRAARSWTIDALDSAWHTATAGDDITRQQRVDIRLATANAMQTGLACVDTAFHLAGGGALYDTQPLQRCWRDLHAGNGHIFFSNNHLAAVGRALLAQPTDELLI